MFSSSTIPAAARSRASQALSSRRDGLAKDEETTRNDNDSENSSFIEPFPDFSSFKRLHKSAEIAHFGEKPVVLHPVGLDVHPELQRDWNSKHFLKLALRRLANGLYR